MFLDEIINITLSINFLVRLADKFSTVEVCIKLYHISVLVIFLTSFLSCSHHQIKSEDHKSISAKKERLIQEIITSQTEELNKLQGSLLAMISAKYKHVNSTQLNMHINRYMTKLSLESDYFYSSRLVNFSERELKEFLNTVKESSKYSKQVHDKPEKFQKDLANFIKEKKYEDIDKAKQFAIIRMVQESGINEITERGLKSNFDFFSKNGVKGIDKSEQVKVIKSSKAAIMAANLMVYGKHKIEDIQKLIKSFEGVVYKYFIKEAPTFEKKVRVLQEEFLSGLLPLKNT